MRLLRRRRHRRRGLAALERSDEIIEVPREQMVQQVARLGAGDGLEHLFLVFARRRRPCGVRLRQLVELARNVARDVLADATLSRAEKRAILASWASDAAAVTSCPGLRAIPGARRLVPIDEILEALSSLDHSPRTPPGGKPARLKSTDRVVMAA